MKRNPRKLKWTKAFRKAAGKEMVVDSTLQFAARRHVPVRYDRELYQQTLAAMSRIAEIRQRRERAFYRRRVRGKRAQELSEARRLVARNEHLLPRLKGSEKRALRENGVAEAEIERMEGELKGNRDMVEPARAAGEEVVRKGKIAKKLAKKARIMVTADGGEVVEERDAGGVDDDAWVDADDGDDGEGMEVDVM